MTSHRYRITLAATVFNVIFFAGMSRGAAMDEPHKPPVVRLVDSVSSFATRFDAECDAPVSFIRQNSLPDPIPPRGLSVEVLMPQCSVPVAPALPSAMPPQCCVSVGFVLPPLMPSECHAPVGFFLPPPIPPQGACVPLEFPEMSLETPSASLGSKRLSLANVSFLARSAFSVSELNLKLPLCGIDPEFAQTTAARMVLTGLLDRSLDQRLPQWRPLLADLIANPKRNINSDTVFQLLLSGCEGIDEFARMKVAENWAYRFESGKFYGEITLAVARRLFDSGKYAEAALKCSSVKEGSPILAVRAMILKALSETYSGDIKKAYRTLDEAKTDYADSPEMPEVHYIEAWLALQDMRIDEAKSILKSIVQNSPRSPAALKAEKTLQSLEMPQ